jgi:hypothetical protein
MCRDPNVLVADCYSDGAWSIEFRRSLTESEARELDHLLSLLQHVLLDLPTHDDAEWSLDRSRSFTTKSLYRFITHRGVCEEL